MSAADEDTELRDLVAQTLHQQGVLSKIKAQLRSSVFLALDEHEQGKLDHSKSPLVNHKLKSFLETPQGIQTVSLVRDFLQYFNLDYTLSVFEPELNHIDQNQFLSSDELRELHNLQPNDNDGSNNNKTPLLVEFVEKSLNFDPDTRKSFVEETSGISQRKPEKPAPPSVAPAASFIDFEESFDRKDGLMGSFSYEESPRSPRKPVNLPLNNFGDSNDLLSLGGHSNQAAKSQLFDQDNIADVLIGASTGGGGAGSHVSDLYESDFGSSANSINIPLKSSRSKGPSGGGVNEKSEVSEELDEEDEELDEEISDGEDDEDHHMADRDRETTQVNDAKNTIVDVTTDHSMSRMSDTEADLDFAEEEGKL